MVSIDLLEVPVGPRVRGCFTTRGARAASVTRSDPYAGLNLAAHVGDDPERVARNRRLLTAEPDHGVAWMNQVHSAVVAPARRGETPTADALVLRRDDPRAPCAAGVLVADCVPLLLATGDGALMAAVHAGRRGMLDGVVPATIDSLRRGGVEPADLWAAVGPSICGSCYEVPEEMLVLSAQREPACASRTSWGTPGIDVAAGVLAQLERAGVGHISAGQWCTYEDPRFFSYRRDGVTGRLAGVGVPR